MSKQLYQIVVKALTCLVGTRPVLRQSCSAILQLGEELLPLESWEVPLASLKGRMRARDYPVESCHGL